MQITFSDPEQTYHYCESRREGDWIIYTCKDCKDFERRYNWRTGEYKSKPASGSYIMHQGSYAPPALEGSALSLPN